MAEMDTVKFEMVTPERLLVSQQVHMVVIPGGEGNFGVLPGHSPLLSTIRPGTIALYGKDNKIAERLFVEGGFAEVTPESCTVLVEVAVTLRNITMEMADERVQKANDALMDAGTDGERRGAERELEAAEAMLAAVDEARKDHLH
ncbi:ATP synthase F1 subunit epsilon [Magnetospira sp. QH-2]|uniref:ATP synthase F1 subunit epsilon n=1 Tax=Magnetospira sp. (strain QH-2) TaxID=1288970 RepID=UPI0003E81546|nr:ATP synthase F1 subunit epsilon [Magnetospira sp. QH-2]CCQ72369.1 F1 sector of membrane-bound ATP synthase, epsilon subunit [Magnetospira sp. QH-2]